jgi:hypothetical protein
MSRTDPVWFPYVFLGVFIVLAGFGLAAGWTLVRGRGQRESFLVLGLAVALVLLGVVGERADRSGGAFGDSLMIVGLPIAVGLVVAATMHVLVGTRGERWPVIPWAAGGGLALGLVVVVGAMLVLPTPEEIRTLEVHRLDAPEESALVLSYAEVEAASPSLARGIRDAASSQTYVEAPLGEYTAFWDLISSRLAAPSSDHEVAITIEGVGYRVAHGPVA